MKFETVTYTASSFECAIGPASESSHEAVGLTESITAFLIRLAAYFQGYVASLPRPKDLPQTHTRQQSLTVIDAGLESGSEPLQKVRMNRALSRRLRWLMRRGRVQRSEKVRLATAKDEARCRMSPGQFNEYCIRVYRESRVQAYGLGFKRRILRLIGISAADLKGDISCLRKAKICAAPLTPD